MRILKPGWVTHADDHGARRLVPIFSIDVQPGGGSRFVTGGADFKARVWALGPLLDEAHQKPAQPDSTCPRLLAALSARPPATTHTGRSTVWLSVWGPATHGLAAVLLTACSWRRVRRLTRVRSTASAGRRMGSTLRLAAMTTW